MNKTPYFLRIKPETIFQLRELSKARSVTVTSIIEDALEKYLVARPKFCCWHCGHELIWGGDHDVEDNEEYDMETNLSCPNCDSFYLVYKVHD